MWPGGVCPWAGIWVCGIVPCDGIVAGACCAKAGLARASVIAVKEENTRPERMATSSSLKTGRVPAMI
jgi:hypothetical protein